jgi:hypothetical protein
MKEKQAQIKKSYLQYEAIVIVTCHPIVRSHKAHLPCVSQITLCKPDLSLPSNFDYLFGFSYIQEYAI